MTSLAKYFVACILVVTSGAVAVWTGIVVGSEHSVDDFKSHNHLPLIALIVGCVCAIIAISNFLRLFNCTGSGFCNSGISITTFILMLAGATALFTQYFRLSKSERTDFKDEHKNYYYLATGEVAFFILYALLVSFQLLCRCCGCCKKDEYGSKVQPVFV